MDLIQCAERKTHTASTRSSSEFGAVLSRLPTPSAAAAAAAADTPHQPTRVLACHHGSASRDVIVVDPSEKKRLSFPSTAAPDTPPNMVELCLDTACSCLAYACVILGVQDIGKDRKGLRV